MTEENQVIEQQPDGVVQEDKEVNEVAVVEAPKEAPKSADHNWREANRVMLAQKQELEMLKTQMEALAKATPPPPPEKDEFDDMAPDDFLTVEKARRMASKMAEKQAKAAAEKSINEYAKAQAIQSDEQRMRAAKNDYDYIIDNFAIPLMKKDPALAYKIQMSKNPAEVAYKLGKLSDEYEAQVTEQQTSPKAEKIMKNASRPTSAVAVSPSLKGQTADIMNMSKADIWAQS